MNVKVHIFSMYAGSHFFPHLESPLYACCLISSPSFLVEKEKKKCMSGTACIQSWFIFFFVRFREEVA